MSCNCGSEFNSEFGFEVNSEFDSEFSSEFSSERNVNRRRGCRCLANNVRRRIEELERAFRELEEEGCIRSTNHRNCNRCGCNRCGCR